ncbi:hypothetical protein, partial [Peribacillus frigoritolerans]|uniref:hypothetical protein n=1 Tax=Peribacillus frigoritolerans TaxID=450367 RepID=UPI002281841B
KKTLRLGDEGDVHEFGVFTRESMLLFVNFELLLRNWSVTREFRTFTRVFRVFTHELGCLLVNRCFYS